MDEQIMIKRCQQNDMGAFKMIFEQYGQSMMRTALRFLGNRQDAEDVVQTTFLKLFRGIKNFKFRSKFSTYLYRILVNNCYDSLRMKRIEPENLENISLAINPEPGLGMDLERAINKLPPRMKTCFILYAIEGFKQEEIAGILKMSLGTVKATIFRARKNLMDLLADTRREKSHEMQSI